MTTRSATPCLRQRTSAWENSSLYEPYPKQTGYNLRGKDPNTWISMCFRSHIRVVSVGYDRYNLHFNCQSSIYGRFQIKYVCNWMNWRFNFEWKPTQLWSMICGRTFWRRLNVKVWDPKRKPFIGASVVRCLTLVGCTSMKTCDEPTKAAKKWSCLSHQEFSGDVVHFFMGEPVGYIRLNTLH